VFISSFKLISPSKLDIILLLAKYFHYLFSTADGDAEFADFQAVAKISFRR